MSIQTKRPGKTRVSQRGQLKQGLRPREQDERRRQGKEVYTVSCYTVQGIEVYTVDGARKEKAVDGARKENTVVKVSHAYKMCVYVCVYVCVCVCETTVHSNCL